MQKISSSYGVTCCSMRFCICTERRIPQLTMIVHLKAWGDLACFTRPEMKVERVSYAVITPSAARGLLEAILYRPEFRWHIRRIAVRRPIRFLAFRRNEVKS